MPSFTDAELDLLAVGQVPRGWAADLIVPALVQELRLARSAAGDAGRRVIDAAAKMIAAADEFGGVNDNAVHNCLDELADALTACPGTTLHHFADQVEASESWQAEKAAATLAIHTTASRPIITAAAHSLLMALRSFRWCLGVSYTSDDGGTLVVCVTAVTLATGLPETWYGWPVGVVEGAPKK